MTELGAPGALEVIDKGACTESHPAPLLFVHGAWHGAWCWDEHFLNFFAERGYRAMALSLRCHGTSSSPKALRWCSIADYLKDVEVVASGLPASPVVIGHSMGGYIAQKYLELHHAPAGVLVAAVPPQGALKFVARLYRRLPWLTTKALVAGNSLPCFGTPQLARAGLFSAGVPDSDVARYAERLQNESQRITLDAMLLHLPRPKRINTPMLVLGAELDACFSQKEVHATARAYGTEAEIFPAMAHDMMLEPDWATVAQRIDTWLRARGL
jgi:pimeloyl-ACP methyl ester carboxylesterase